MLFNTLLLFLLLFVLYLVHKYFIKPYQAIQFYKKQGFKLAFYHPLFGMRKLMNEGIKKFHDFAYHRNHLLELYPGTRGMVTNFLDGPLLLLSDTSLKKDYFVYKQPFYEKHPLITSFLRNPAIEKRPTLILAEGEEWKRIRRILSKTFHHDFIMSNINLMSSVADTVFNNIKDLDNVNLMNEFSTITGNVILSSMLGDDFLERKYRGLEAPVVISQITSQVTQRRFNPIYQILGKRISQKLFSSFKKEVEYQQDFYKNFLMKYVQEKYDEYVVKMKENPSYQGKFLSESMFKLVMQKEENFSLNEVGANINFLFIAGTDTTGHLLAHLIYILWKESEVYQKLMSEIDSNSSAIENLDFEVIKNMEYLSAVIKEGLRQVSPAADIFIRKAIKDHNLGDLFIKKGTSIFLGLSTNCNDPEIFRDPHTFRPERWIKGDPMFDNAEEKDPYCYLPFSAGQKNCLGQHMSIVESKIILAKFLMRFKFDLKIKEPITWVMRFVAEPEEPLIAKLSQK